MSSPNSNGTPDVFINYDAILAAGNMVMTEDVQQGRTVERGFGMMGTLDIDERTGRTRAHVTRLVNMGTGTRSTFTVTPRLSQAFTEHAHTSNQRILGLAHTHPEPLSPAPSPQDIQYFQTNAAHHIGLVLQARPDGGGSISVFNGTGFIDYTLVGASGRAQSFEAEGRGRVNNEHLQGDARRAPVQSLAA